MEITREQRNALLGKIQAAVAEKYFDPAFDNDAWTEIVERHRGSIVEASDTEAFERGIAAMLTELSPKTLGLLSERSPITSRNAINASFSIETVSGARRWVFQDILPGGVAANAGIQPGDVLLTSEGSSITPSATEAAEPAFAMNRSISLSISRGDPPAELYFTLSTGGPKYKDNPYSNVTALTVNRGSDGIGYLRVSLFPGKIGIDFANEVDALFKESLADAANLIIDLRGNPGGGIGGLALMSHLTPIQLPVGYSKNRKMAIEQQHPSSLPIFDRVPRSKLAIPGLAFRFFGKTSVFLYTEALGRRPQHGRIVIITNQHTTGAAEMLAQFAQENKLATIVGTKTPGRLVSRTATKIGLGYRLVVPVAAYVSAKGTQIEGKGITPDVEVPWSFADAVAGHDNQLAAATASLREASADR